MASALAVQELGLVDQGGPEDSPNGSVFLAVRTSSLCLALRRRLSRPFPISTSLIVYRGTATPLFYYRSSASNTARTTQRGFTVAFPRLPKSLAALRVSETVAQQKEQVRQWIEEKRHAEKLWDQEQDQRFE